MAHTANNKEMKKLSIVIPVYYNEANLLDTIPRLVALNQQLDSTELELIFVDDGSGDNSFAILQNHLSKHPSIIKLVKLTRNFGSMAAITAGLAHSTGNCVGVISADLQDPPELFVEMAKHWETGKKCIFAVRENRDDGWNQKIFSYIFYQLLRRYAIPNFPKGGFDFFLIDREVVDLVVSCDEKNTNLMSLIYWYGFPNVMLPYTREAREKGKSRWTFAKRIKLFVDSFTGFSYLPIRALSLTGFATSFAGLVYLAIVSIAYLRNDIPVSGWTSIILVTVLTSGIQMSMLGVLGEYLWRNFDESRNRPSFIIEKIEEK